MNINAIRYFVAVCRRLSFTAAARSCGVSQPTLSIAINSLERELGQQLCHRRPRVELTDFGRQVYPLMEGIIEATEKVAAIAATPRMEAIPIAPINKIPERVVGSDINILA
jgi:DNA-binding transcriptional LysR family regulator